MMSGRAQAKAPGSGVRVGLGARDPEPEAEPKSARLLPARVRSTLFPEEETDGFPATAHPRAMAASEDQDAPAEEAPASSSRTTTAKLASGNTATTTRAGWNPRQRPSSGPSTRSRADDGRRRDQEWPAHSPTRSRTTARTLCRRRSSPGTRPRPDRPVATRACSQRHPDRCPTMPCRPRAMSPPHRIRGAWGRPPTGTSSRRRARHRTSGAARAPHRRRRAGLVMPAPPRTPPIRTARPRTARLARVPLAAPPGASCRSARTTCRWTRRSAAARARTMGMTGAPSCSQTAGRARDDAEEAQDREVVEKARPRRVRPAAGSPMATPAKRSKAAAPGPLEAVCRMDPGHRRVLELEAPRPRRESGLPPRHRRRHHRARLLGELVRPVPQVDRAPPRAPAGVRRQEGPGHRHRVRGGGDVRGASGHGGRRRQAARDQLPRARHDQGRGLPGAGGLPGAVLSDDGRARPRG